MVHEILHLRRRRISSSCASEPRSSQGNQLLPPLEGTSSKLSAPLTQQRSSEGDGSPKAKRARSDTDNLAISQPMGSVKHYSANTNTVGYRLLENTNKLKAKNTKNGLIEDVPTFKSPANTFRDRKVLNERQKTTVRLISQYLRDLGLRETVECLTDETGCSIEHVNANRLRQHILKGEWDGALSLLDRSENLMPTENHIAVKQEILVQKFYSLILQSDRVSAFRFLCSIQPVYKDNREIQSLHRIILMPEKVFKKNEKFKELSDPNYRASVLKAVEKLAPADFMLPYGRVDELLNQAIEHQKQSCRLHLDDSHKEQNVKDLLMYPHNCAGRNLTNCHHAQELKEHNGEIYCAKFSYDGKLLATASKSTKIIIYRVNKKNLALSVDKELSHSQFSVQVDCMSWSYDRKMLAIACSEQDRKARFDTCVFNVESGQLHRLVKSKNHYYSSCAFVWNSYTLAVGNQSGTLCIYDVTHPLGAEPIEIKCQWEGYRISQFETVRDSNAIIALDSLNRVRRYQWGTDQLNDQTLIHENVHTTAFAMHKTQRFIVTVTQLSLNLWDVASRQLLRHFSGEYSENIVKSIRFGGVNHDHFVFGCKDGRLLVYNINHTMPVAKLRRHSECINVVAWHPKAHGLIVSGGEQSLNVYHLGCQMDCLANLRQSVIEKAQLKLDKELQERKLKRKQLKTEGGEGRTRSKDSNDRERLISIRKEQLPQPKKRKEKLKELVNETQEAANEMMQDETDQVSAMDTTDGVVVPDSAVGIDRKIKHKSKKSKKRSKSEANLTNLAKVMHLSDKPSTSKENKRNNGKLEVIANNLVK